MWAQWLIPFPGPEKTAPYRWQALRRKRWSSAFSYPVCRILWSMYCVAWRTVTEGLCICSNSSQASVPVASWRRAWSIFSEISSPGSIFPSARCDRINLCVSGLAMERLRRRTKPRDL